jgi:uncharacterized protein YyaL (SSP411 family)
VTPEGNFDDHNILNRLKHLPRNIEDEKRLAPMREKLLAARTRRVRPALDDKVLADWNGLMISALVNASLAFDQPHWLEMAARAFLFIDAKMAHGDRLGHSWREGKLLLPGLASDHASMIRAALALHEATGEHAYLERALAWQGTLDRHYSNPGNGGYFLTADDAKDLVVRPSATTDDATPNPNALAAQNLVRLAVFTGQHAWRDKADRLFDGIVASAGENLFAHLASFNALDLRLRAAEIIVTGKDARANALLTAARKLPYLDRIVLRASSTLPMSHPAQEKIKAATESAAFVCAGEICSLPVTEPDALAESVISSRPHASST